ncbi:MAG TPA: SpoIID/LytB domain-containing protein [Candidatus Omnitrophota bacterium]|nr:SpoIID/LytB domain-containing protein [Candidatus Omnitrophota bacterium]
MRKNLFLVSGVILLTLLAFFLFFSEHPVKKSRQHGKGPLLRVRISRDAASGKFYSPAPCDITNPLTGEILKRKVSFPESSGIKVFSGKIVIGKESFRDKNIRLSPGTGGGFFFDGVEYRGELDILVSGEVFSAINRVQMEDYLKGVVPREVHGFWPMSALKAQAVASRSYAAFEAARRKNLPYDLTSDTYTQVYGGKSAERSRTTKAVTLTSGEVLKYDGKVIPGYFHSSCGGHTTTISSVWNGRDMEPFMGVRSRSCRWSPSFRWRARIPTGEILEKLRRYGYGFDRIDYMRPGKVDGSGRVEYVRIKSGNRWFEVPIKDFTSSIGRSTLKSSNFRIRKYPLFYDFDGYGWGHGVGMCQWCSFGMALRGWDYLKILGFFYPGATVSQLGRSIQ